MPELLLVPVGACPRAHLKLETLTLDSLLPKSTATGHGYTTLYFQANLGKIWRNIFFEGTTAAHIAVPAERGRQPHTRARPRASQHAPQRARARPHGDNPSSLPGASAFNLVVTPRPRLLPEVAGRELGARRRAVPDWFWETPPGGRTRRGESVPSEGRTFTCAARSGVRPGEHGGAATPSAAAGTAVEPATTRGGSRGRPRGG